MTVERPRRPLIGASLIGLVLWGFLAVEGAFAQPETPLEILAVRVREQGHPCGRPLKAERDRRASVPNETVWVLECDNARYRVVLIPDMAARIEKLE